MDKDLFCFVFIDLNEIRWSKEFSFRSPTKETFKWKTFSSTYHIDIHDRWLINLISFNFFVWSIKIYSEWRNIDKNFMIVGEGRFNFILNVIYYFYKLLSIAFPSISQWRQNDSKKFQRFQWKMRIFLYCVELFH